MRLEEIQNCRSRILLTRNQLSNICSVWNATLPNRKKQTNKSTPPQDSPHQRVQKQQLHPWVSRRTLWIGINQIMTGSWFSTTPRVCSSMSLPYLGQNACQELKTEDFGEVKNKSLPGRHGKSLSWNLNQIKAHMLYIHTLFIPIIRNTSKGPACWKKGAPYVRQCVRSRSL